MQITVPAQEPGINTRSHAFSGNERHRLFINLAGTDFARLSLLSGLDKKADGRGWARVDLDGDGWLDVIQSSPQAPRFRFFTNRLNTLLPGHRALRLRLVGGNNTPMPTRTWSSRDPVGAIVTARWGKRQQRAVLASSEGMAAQNEPLLHLGVGEWKEAVDLEIRWPSGKVTTRKILPGEIGTLVEIHERGEEADSSE